MGLWPVGGSVSLVWGNLGQSAYPPPPRVGPHPQWMVRHPLSVHENTIFTERMVVKTGKIFRPAGSGV